MIQPNFAVQNFSDTSVSYKIKTITGTSAGSSSQVETPFYPIVENENNVLVEPMAIYNNLNNVSTLKDVPSLVFSVSMSSSNSCLSPIIDTDRMSAILINNTFDDPSEDTTNNEELDVNPIISNQEYGFCGVVSGCETLKGVKVTEEQHTVTVSNPEIEGGKVAEVSLTRNSEGVVTSVEVNESGYGYTKAPIITVVDNGTTKTYTADYTQKCIYTENVDNIVSARECREGEFVEIRYERGNNVFAKVEDVVTDENVLFIFTDTDLSGMTVEKDSVIVRRAAFIDETAPVGGTVLAKYITKPISFANSCNYLRIMMAMCVPQSSNVDVYYKAYQNGGSKQYDDVSWVLVNPTNGIKKVEIGSDVFTDVEYDVEYKDGENIPSFDVVAVKVVFRGTNTSAVPKIKDLRIIACE